MPAARRAERRRRRSGPGAAEPGSSHTLAEELAGKFGNGQSTVVLDQDEVERVVIRVRVEGVIDDYPRDPDFDDGLGSGRIDPGDDGSIDVVTELRQLRRPRSRSCSGPDRRARRPSQSSASTASKNAWTVPSGVFGIELGARPHRGDDGGNRHRQRQHHSDDQTKGPAWSISDRRFVAHRDKAGTAGAELAIRDHPYREPRFIGVSGSDPFEPEGENLPDQFISRQSAIGASTTFRGR